MNLLSCGMTIAAIDKLYESENKNRKPRYHLGASLLGHHCDRYLWLTFRWVVPENFSGRILQLFEFGNVIEEIVVERYLKRCGYIVEKCLKNQQYFDLGCHLKGASDGIIKGIPEAPTKTHTLEIKSSNNARFRELGKNGVKASNPQHYTQCQIAMYAHGLDRAFYFAVNKDNNEKYAERIAFEPGHAERAIERGQSIALDRQMPPLDSPDPAWWKCKMCGFYSWCHQSDQQEIQRHCRTCALCAPRKNSSWYCSQWRKSVPKEFQPVGCKHYRRMPL